MSSSVPLRSRGILDIGNTPSPMMPAASSDENTVTISLAWIANNIEMETYIQELGRSSGS